MQVLYIQTGAIFYVSFLCDVAASFRLAVAAAAHGVCVDVAASLLPTDAAAASSTLPTLRRQSVCGCGADNARSWESSHVDEDSPCPRRQRSSQSTSQSRKICSAWTPLRTCFRVLRRERSLRQIRSSSPKPWLTSLSLQSVFSFPNVKTGALCSLSSVTPLRPAAMLEWHQTEAFETAVFETYTFASSPGYFKINTLDHMRKLNDDALIGNNVQSLTSSPTPGIRVLVSACSLANVIYWLP